MNGATHRGLIDRIGGAWTRQAGSASHLPGLDAARFAAALMVAITHLGVLPAAIGPWGGNGVAIFFVLSGYLLWRPFARGKPSVYHYTLTRAARILPAWWLACVVLVPLFGGSLVQYLAMIQTDKTLGVAWTLQAEIMFYLAVPLLAWFGRPLLVPLAFGLASLALELSMGGFRGSPLETVLPVRFWSFVPGMVLAATGWKGNHYTLAGGIALLWVGALTNEWWGGQWANLATVAGASLVVASALAMRPPGVRVWAAGAAISYGLYLWHSDLEIAFGAWGLALAFVAAALSYVLIERPVMRWAHSRRRVPAIAEQRPEPVEVLGVPVAQDVG